jgi:uncharacterized protein YdhG (YjbR/CyaY superfamily)
MKAQSVTPNSIDEYISGFPDDIQEILERLRATIKKAAPQSVEVISYGMPAFRLNGMLVYFAARPNHIGFYPTPSGINAFKKELSMFKSAKGSVQFPIGEPLPLGLIRRITKFRVNENSKRSETKQKKK